MRSIAVLLFAVATLVQVEAHVNKRQTSDTSTSYLPAMIGAATANCQSPCDDIARVIKTCTDAGADDELEVARCACAMSTLDVIRNCASCVSNDKTSTLGPETLGWYNAFVNQCVSLTLADGSELMSVPGLAVTTASAITTFSMRPAPSMTPGPSSVDARISSAASEFAAEFSSFSAKVSAAEASVSAEIKDNVAATAGTSASSVASTLVVFVVAVAAGGATLLL